jgi:hypothetical protein
MIPPDYLVQACFLSIIIQVAFISVAAQALLPSTLPILSFDCLDRLVYVNPH